MAMTRRLTVAVSAMAWAMVAFLVAGGSVARADWDEDSWYEIRECVSAPEFVGEAFRVTIHQHVTQQQRYFARVSAKRQGQDVRLLQIGVDGERRVYDHAIEDNYTGKGFELSMTRILGLPESPRDSRFASITMTLGAKVISTESLDCR